ncbi:hypothetical protein ACHAPQ_012457, partial [Fusarium lateritium]
CDKKDEKWDGDDDIKNPICKPKCPKSGQKWLSDGEKEDDAPICGCVKKEEKLDDGECKPKCTVDNTVFVKDGEDGEPPVCECDDEKNYLTKTGCKPKCPKDAVFKKNGDEWTCDRPNTDEVFTKATSDSGPNCALLQCPCDAPDFRASNGVCVPDCGTQATLDSARTTCICKKRGQKFTKSDKSCACDIPLVWSDGSCHMSCGKYANWDKSRKECVCQKRGQLFDDESSTCACPGKKIWDSSQCIPNCGDYATWNGRNKACICDKKGQVFTPSTSSCDCPDGEKWIGNVYC